MTPLKNSEYKENSRGSAEKQIDQKQFSDLASMKLSPFAYS